MKFLFNYGPDNGEIFSGINNLGVFTKIIN